MKQDNLISELDNYNKLLKSQLDSEQLKGLQMQKNLGEMSFNPPEKSVSLAETQLNIDKELDRIFHLLSGQHLGVNEEGHQVWMNPTDDRMIILSKYGIMRIMNLISFYLNPNTLLSNYDDKTIVWKLKDFAHALNDLFLTVYEKLFYYPTPEELYELHIKNLSKLDYKITEEELYDKCLQWSKEELDNKIRNYPTLLLAIVDTVHSTYLRAWHGQERKSLRENIHKFQNPNDNNLVYKKGFFGGTKVVPQ